MQQKLTPEIIIAAISPDREPSAWGFDSNGSYLLWVLNFKIPCN
jgi:hypothetical protein